jgi:hypothetical protein
LLARSTSRTSLAVTLSAAMRCGSSQMRMAGERPNTRALATPSSAWTWGWMTRFTKSVISGILTDSL